MRINTPKEKYIFIELNKNDMKQLNLSYDDMDYSDEETRKTIYSVLNQAKNSLNQDFELSDTLSVEVLPRDDGGCLLFFTIGKRARKYRLCQKEGEVVYLFESIDEFLDLAAAIKKSSLSNVKSSLYCVCGKYYMKITGSLRHSLISVMNEFARNISKTEVPFFYESQCVIKNNALEMLCR